MEASQASEAGSIPVARSTPARPRAGRFCYACAGGFALHEGPTRRSDEAFGVVGGGICTTRGSDTPVTRGAAASCSAKPPPLQAGRAHGAYKTVRNTGWREKTRPARLLHRHFREKTRPTRLKTAFFAHFGLAGRTISRSHPPSGRAGRTFSRPAWHVLEVEMITTTTTHSYSPHETASATAHLR